MAKFAYIARDGSGKKVNGSLEGLTEEDVINRLQAMELLVLEVHPEGDSAGAAGPSETPMRIGAQGGQKHYGVRSNDLVLFCRQLATLLGAGVTILKSLETISRQVASQKLYKVIGNLKHHMESGLSFHEALAKEPTVFSDLWVNLVESGEASGNLAIVLDRLAMYLERNAEFKRKVISSLIYPSILLGASMAALLFLTIKIVPTFAEVFKSFNIKLPGPTIVLIAVSTFIRKTFVFIVIGLAGLYYFFMNYIKTKEGRKAFEEFLFRLPMFGEFFRAMAIERFSSEMSTLIESGVPILYSLEITESSVGSVVIGEIIRGIKEDVRAGRPLSQPLERSGFFEPMVVQMVHVGEEIGELSQMFKRINTFYQSYVETFLARFLSLFEPFILIFMGSVIGLMVIGMFLPIFQISKVGSAG
ncbi:MAG: type II secretion system F family protein [Candidatus Omnitrophica bacterium]|nr:type II secretion system F family protein [Candidatus Omnitrophota bacterium]